jgi:hypothetical protein
MNPTTAEPGGNNVGHQSADTFQGKARRQSSKGQTAGYPQRPSRSRSATRGCGALPVGGAGLRTTSSTPRSSACPPTRGCLRSIGLVIPAFSGLLRSSVRALSPRRSRHHVDSVLHGCRDSKAAVREVNGSCINAEGGPSDLLDSACHFVTRRSAQAPRASMPVTRKTTLPKRIQAAIASVK